MKVAELIAILQRLPADATAVFPEPSHGAFYSTSYVEVSGPELLSGERYDATGGEIASGDVVVIA